MKKHTTVLREVIRCNVIFLQKHKLPSSQNYQPLLENPLHPLLYKIYITWIWRTSLIEVLVHNLIKQSSDGTKYSFSREREQKFTMR